MFMHFKSLSKSDVKLLVCVGSNAITDIDKSEWSEF